MSNEILLQFAVGLLALGMAALGWFLREVWAAVKELRQGLATLRENLPLNYVQKDDYKIDIGRIYELLDRIHDKLTTFQGGGRRAVQPQD